jgi:hypothetical protein
MNVVDHQRRGAGASALAHPGTSVPAGSAAATAAAGLVYALVTALLFRDLLPHVTTDLYSDVGDPLLNAAVLEWGARHVPLSTEWWNFPSFAPLSGVTAFTEHLLAAYPVSAPIIWLTGNAVLAHNVVLLLAFPLNGLAAYLLAREVTGSSLAAFIGGLAFAFAPYHSTHLSHVQTLMAFGMPLALLGLHRYLARRRGALVLVGVGWLITALSNAYMLLFFPLLALCWCAWFVRPREWRRLVPPAVTAAIFTIPVIPLLWGYHVRQAAYGFSRSIMEIRAFSADMVGLAGVSHRESLWRGILPNTYEERSLFPGVTIAMLAILAVFVSWRSGSPSRSTLARRLLLAAGVLGVIVVARVWTGPFAWHVGPVPLPAFAPFRVVTVAALALVIGILLTPGYRDAWARRDPVMFYATAAVAFWLLALGPQPEWSGSWRALAYGPYSLLIHLPGLDSIRVPARAWLPSLICLSVLAAAGAAYLASVVPRTGVALIVSGIALAIVAEGWFYDRHVPAPEMTLTGVIPAGAVVLDLPIEQGFWNATPQYRAVRGGYLSVNGYSGYQPDHFQPTRRAIADLRSDALNPFLMLADLYVIVRPDTLAEVARWVAEHPGAERIHAGPDAEVFRLPRLHPEAPRRSLPLPLPRPGARPFGS